MSGMTEPLVLGAGVTLEPVAELPEAVRRQLDWTPGDHALSRPGLRTGSRVVDAAAADLLRQFATPSTLVEAVMRHSQACGGDAEALLDAAYPLLARLLREGFLVPAADGGRGRIDASWAAAERIAGCTVQRCVQVLVDTEVYQVRTDAAHASASDPWQIARREAALKIVRAPAVGGAGASDGSSPRGSAARLLREAIILDHLGRGGAGAPVAPLLLATGVWQGRRFLALEWCMGLDAHLVAAELRERGAGGLAELLALCRRVAAAYAALHRRGVLHGDVHARNVLVDAGGEVRIIDFGFSTWQGVPASLAQAGRGGVAFYFEPEYAAATLAGRAAPPVTAAGEQYAVAVLLYYLASGAFPQDFSLERQTLLRQIAGDPPLPFTLRGAAAWPALEAVLGRALAQSPADRYPSLDALTAALHDIESGVVVSDEAGRGDGSGRGEAAGPAPLLALSSALRRDPAAALLEQMVAATQTGGELWQMGSGGSGEGGGSGAGALAGVQDGAAGIAYALYRIATVRADPDLLAQAHLWSVRAAGAARSGAATFYDADRNLTPRTIGSASLLHGPPGVHCTAALIANARGDRAAASQALAAFAAAASVPCPFVDLALGRAGLLSAFALLLDALEAGGTVPQDDVGGLAGEAAAGASFQQLRAMGDGLLAGIWRDIVPLRPIEQCREWSNLGIAHGWAGALYAMLRWCRSAGRPLPAGLPGRLDQLAGCAESCGRGIRWRWYNLPAGEPWAPGAAAALRLTPSVDAAAPVSGHTAPPLAVPHDGGAAAVAPVTPMAPIGAMAPMTHGAQAAPEPVWMAGWCNGSAGMVHLWTAAARMLPGGGYERLAVDAAWHVWEAPERSFSLCCGLAGRAYALLDLYQHGCGAEWLERARTLAGRAAAAVAEEEVAGADSSFASSAASLYRGPLGVAVLAADLARPRDAAMPLFGDEGWAQALC